MGVDTERIAERVRQHAFDKALNVATPRMPRSRLVVQAFLDGHLTIDELARYAVASRIRRVDVWERLMDADRQDDALTMCWLQPLLLEKLEDFGFAQWILTDHANRLAALPHEQLVTIVLNPSFNRHLALLRHTPHESIRRAVHEAANMHPDVFPHLLQA